MRGSRATRSLVVAAIAVSIAAPLEAVAGDPDLSAAPPYGGTGETVPELRYKDTKPPPGLWKRPAGKWLTGAGVALLAAGGTFAVLNRQLANDLEDRFAQNRLTAADASDYRKVDSYNLLSASLLATGGLTAAAGLYLWGTAPDLRPSRTGVTFGVKKRF